jgi:hypothetical protein
MTRKGVRVMKRKGVRVMKGKLFKGIVIGAVTAMVVLAGTAALAGSGVGGIFNLGRTNTVNRTSALVGKTAGAMLRVQNKANGPAANFQVVAGKAPFAVNSDVKVGKLNADLLDGVDSSGFTHADEADHAAGADHAANADALGGLPASSYLRGVKVSFVADAPLGRAIVLVLGGLTLEAICASGDNLSLDATTNSDNSWIRVASQGESDFDGDEVVFIDLGSSSGVLVYHSGAGPTVTFQWASWENGTGPDCQLHGTAFMAP